MKSINKITSIRGTLVFYSMTLIFLMALLSFYTLGIMNQYRHQISAMFETHIQLKEIQEQLTRQDENLLGFLSTKSSSRLNNYIIGQEELNDYIEHNDIENELSYNMLLMENISNLTEQYALEADMAIAFKRQRNVKEYSKHYDRSKKIQGFIFEYINEMNQEQMSLNSTAYLDLVELSRWLQLITVIIIVDLIIFSLLVVYMLSSRLLGPIRMLYKSAEAISAGNLQTEDIELKTGDEFGLLAAAFNNMKNSIVDYIDKLKLKAETEAELKDEQMKNLKMAYLLDNAKLNALQSQINPHFLFNTINAGVQLSVIEQATQTGQFLETMSRLFRYNLKMQHDACTLKDEINNIKDYYELLKMRFRDRIKFEFDIEESTLDVLMPAMILQPIVENSYIHGLSSLESGGTITIKGYLEEDYVFLRISDDGVGISEEILADILNPTDENEGIGVKNVKTRLELFYHEQKLFNMYSDNGVTTLIKLPVKR